MPAHGTREHDFLQVTAFAQHVLDSVAMGNARSSLCKTLPLCAIRNWEIAATAPLRAKRIGVLRSKTAVCFIFRPS
jgi:hypothetical protein